MEPEKEVASKINRVKKFANLVWEFASFAVIAVAVVIPIRIFIAQPFIVSGSSMVPTFENSDYLIVDEISYRLGEPKRFDVVIFKYPKDTTKFFIKRIIGLPNETIEIKDNVVKIVNDDHKEGLIIDQPFVKKQKETDNMTITLRNDEYFVMGDNRDASSDSRYWGPVKKDLLVGRAFIRLLPINEIELLPGN